MTTLFRHEALEAQFDHADGQIVLARSTPIGYLAVGSGSIALLILALLFFGEYTKRTASIGLLVPSAGAIRVIPPIAGGILEAHIKEGQFVHKGDVLFVLGDSRSALLGETSMNLAETVSHNIRRKRQELERSRDHEQLTASHIRRGQSSKIEKLTLELGQTEREIALCGSRVSTARQNLDRYRALVQSSFVSAQAVQQKEDELADAEARLLGVERARTSLQNEIGLSENEIRLAVSRESTRMAEIDRDLAGLDQELAESTARYRYEITAPADGIVTTILAQPGQVATNQQPIATLLPAGSALEAQLFIPSKVAGFIEKGQKVRLRFQAYPYQKFGQYDGVVSQVSRSQIEPGDLPSTLPFPPTQAREGLYRISVKLQSQSILAYGKSMSLVAGMIVDADIEQDTRSLIEWVLEPLYALRGKLH